MNYLLRSMLFVPAYNEKFLDKAAKSEADAIIFDLEDAVPPAKRKEARDTLGKYLSDGTFAGKQLFIRVNELGSGDLIKDLKLIDGRRILGVVTPKIKGVSEIREFSNLLKKCEDRDGLPEGTVKLLPLIETAGAVAGVQSIAGSSKRIIALLFGGEDYLDSIWGTHEYSAKAFEIPRAMIVMAARMNNLLPIDTPYMDLKNEAGFMAEERMAYSMGFAGALLVNPVQIPWANRCFCPSEEEAEHAMAVLETAEKAREEGRSIATLEGKVVGPPMLKRANKVMDCVNKIREYEKKKAKGNQDGDKLRRERGGGKMAGISETWLFVPAKEKYAGRIGQIEADAVILDLEDSLAPAQKEAGVLIAADILQRYGGSRKLYVRLNSGERFDREIKALSGFGFAGFMLPKFEDTALLEDYQEHLKGKELIALIESVKGIMELPKIAAHPLVSGLAFGGEDFRRELGFEAGEEATVYARNRLVMYAFYHGKYSLDTVSMEIRDMDKFMEDYKRSKGLGFSGKLLIHPAQAMAVREYYRQSDAGYLQSVVKAFENSADGILQMDGKWYERPHIEKIKKYLRELEAGRQMNTDTEKR